MIFVTLYVVKHFGIGIARLALDNRMFQAFGNVWHRKNQKTGVVPEKLRNVDTTAGWGISAYRGWIYGHAVEVFVTTGAFVFPVLAFARSLVIRGNTATKQFAYLLPKVQKGVVAADSEYCDDELDQLLQETGRTLHAPSKYYAQNIPKSKTYQKRKITVEPFYERFLLAFALRGKLDRKGPQAWPYLVTCCLFYQLMVVHNLITNAQNPVEVTHLIRML